MPRVLSQNKTKTLKKVLPWKQVGYRCNLTFQSCAAVTSFQKHVCPAVLPSPGVSGSVGSFDLPLRSPASWDRRRGHRRPTPTSGSGPSGKTTQLERSGTKPGPLKDPTPGRFISWRPASGPREEQVDGWRHSRRQSVQSCGGCQVPQTQGGPRLPGFC